MSSKTKQLASLAAAGASAIVLTAGKAEASIIYSSVLNTPVDFNRDTLHNFGYNDVVQGFTTFRNSTGPLFRFRLWSTHVNFTEGVRRAYVSAFGGHSTFFNSRTYSIANRATIGSRTWGAGAASHASTGGHHTNSVGRYYGNRGEPSFTNGYLLFTFDPAGTTLHGWLELSMSVTNADNADAVNGPNLTMVQYAWDNTGAAIAPGETPEPSSLAESGLAALILGAEGLRRWRKSRKPSL